MLEYKEMHGFDNSMLETIEGTTEWCYTRELDDIDVDDILELQGQYLGTRMRILNVRTRKTYEPLKQKCNIYIEKPIFYNGKFGILRYDFEREIIEIIEFIVDDEECSVLYEIPFSKLDDFINIRLIAYPFTLVKYNILGDEINVLWPERFKVSVEENEILDFRDNDILFLSKWSEEPTYSEEVIVRKYPTFEIIDRFKGSIYKMNDGSFWKLVK